MSQPARNKPQDFMLTEQVPFYTHLVEVQLEEGKQLPKGVIMQARGKFAHAGKITANGRLYSRSLMKREIDRLNSEGGPVEQKAVIGEADHPHPTVGGPSVRQSAFIITGLGMNEDGEVMGQIDVVGTGAGDDLAALIRAGAQVGFSSRARGSSRPMKMTSSHPEFALNKDWEDKDFEEVNDDLYLVTIDSVIGPAITDAYIGTYNEQREEVDVKLEDILKDEELMKGVLESEAVKKKVEEAVAASKVDMEKKFAEDIKVMVKEHMQSDEFLDQFELAEGEGDEDDLGEAAVKCADCGAALTKGAKYCQACGERVSAPAKKEQSQDEKDKALDDMKKRLEALEKSNEEKDGKIAEHDAKEKAREEAEAVEKIVDASLEGLQKDIVDSVRTDIDELKERGDVLKQDGAKDFVETRVKRYQAFAKATGAKLEEGKAKGQSPDDADGGEPKGDMAEVLDEYD